MSPETFYLLLGIFIGVLSTLLQTIVSYFFNKHENKKQRERAVILNRINQVEIAATKMLNHINSLYDQTKFLVEEGSVDFNTRYASFWKIWGPLQNFYPIETPAYLLKDTELINWIIEFIKLATVITTSFTSASLKRDRDERMEQLSRSMDFVRESSSKILEAHNKILERLDYLRQQL